MISTALIQPNPFNCDAATLRGLLVSLLDEEAPPAAGNGVFRRRAVALIGTVAPVLVWVREHKGVRIDLQQSHFAMQLPNLRDLAARRVFHIRASVSHVVSAIPVPDMPDALIGPLQAYLQGLPGCDGRLPGAEQPSDRPAGMHFRALLILAHAFAHGDAATHPA